MWFALLYALLFALCGGAPSPFVCYVRAVDMQFRKRWKALLSVDDAVAGIANAIDGLDLWDTTYFFVTSE